MKSCTFFGHKDTPQDVNEKLYDTIENLIVNENVMKFYVGNHGSFDFYVWGALENLKKKYPKIDYSIVLAYMPDGSIDYNGCDVYPEGIETVPKRFAIDWRNRWMVNKADFVITYVKFSFGGAAKFKEIAEKKGKVVLNLA